MLNAEVEAHIKNNCSWAKLPQSIKQTLGNNTRHYDKCVIEYSIKNQLRYKGNIVRQVRRDEKKYYEELVVYSRQHLMLYPYHISDVVVEGLRITPFSYYCEMMLNIISQEKSYDSLPNFTAADCLRLLGIGRNQYIEIINQCKSTKRFFRRKPARELLPTKPIEQKVIQAWWRVRNGFVTEDDIKMCSASEKTIVDKLIDEGPKLCGQIDRTTMLGLYNKGLIYFDILVSDDDIIVVPPLENFVMNRILGDYMETMLYKIFVSIDEQTKISELAQVLEIDITLVKQAIAVFCRLGLARKKNVDLDFSRFDSSWNEEITPALRRNLWKNQKCLYNPEKIFQKLLISFGGSQADLLVDVVSKNSDHSGAQTPLSETSSTTDMVSDTEIPAILSQESSSSGKRIAFLFDSTLTAFLMMGNLSQGLKRHSVTMFEVGKLSDESMDSLLQELEKVENVAEGEARRYFDHAVVLKDTIHFLRNNKELSFEEENGNILALDLLRCESMNSLDPAACARILNKRYSLLISMAPLSNEIRPLASCTPPHLGPAIPEVNSVWFKLFLYSKISCGPPSILLVKGTRVRKLPKIFKSFERLQITTWGHDPAVVPTSNVLMSLNDALSHSPVLVQGHGLYGEGDIENVSFPVDAEKLSDDSKKGNQRCKQIIKSINDTFDLNTSCGYITLLNLSARKRKNLRQMPNILTLVSDEFHDSDNEDGITMKLVDTTINAKETKTSETSSTATTNAETNIVTDSTAENRRENSDGVTNNSEKVDNSSVSDETDTAHRKGNLTNLRGLETPPISPLRHKVTSVTSSENLDIDDIWEPLQLSYGIPLFDTSLNKDICKKLVSRQLCKPESLERMLCSSRKLSLELLDFIAQYQDASPIQEVCAEPQLHEKPLPHPNCDLIFANGKLSQWDGK